MLSAFAQRLQRNRRVSAVAACLTQARTATPEEAPWREGNLEIPRPELLRGLSEPADELRLEAPEELAHLDARRVEERRRSLLQLFRTVVRMVRQGRRRRLPPGRRLSCAPPRLRPRSPLLKPRSAPAASPAPGVPSRAAARASESPAANILNGSSFSPRRRAAYSWLRPNHRPSSSTSPRRSALRSPHLPGPPLPKGSRPLLTRLLTRTERS